MSSDTPRVDELFGDVSHRPLSPMLDDCRCLARKLESALAAAQAELAQARADAKRLDWLDETQALCDDGDGTPYYQEWSVRASENYRGIRQAIDAAMKP